MKAGLSLQELAIELHRQNGLKKDYLINTGAIQLDAYDDQVYLQIHDNDSLPLEPFDVNSIAHQQLGTYTGIPASYYNRMLAEDPVLLTKNVNSWLHREPAQRMVRTMDGTARAFLSNRYRRIDNMEILEIVLPELMKIPDAKYESCQVTDSRMYIKVVNPRLQAEVTPGDIVQAGVIISNSEVGQGSVSIQPLVYRLVCSNGMVINDAQTRKYAIFQIKDECWEAAWRNSTPKFERDKHTVKLMSATNTDFEIYESTKNIMRGLAYFENQNVGLIPHELDPFFYYRGPGDNAYDFEKLSKVSRIRLYKNGRVDIRFVEEAYAVQFATDYLGTRPWKEAS